MYLKYFKLAILYILLKKFLIQVTIPYKKGCSVHLYLHLFVGGIMSYLHYLCLFAYTIVVCFYFIFLKKKPRSQVETILVHKIL
jgi:hypothetical protein